MIFISKKDVARLGIEATDTSRTVDVLTLRLPLPPSANNLYPAVRGRRRVKSKEYTGWLAECEWGRAKFPPHPPVRTPCRIDMVIVGKVNRQRDGSNMLKAPEDLLKRWGIIPDDNLLHVVAGSWTYRRTDDPPFIEVTVTHVEKP